MIPPLVVGKTRSTIKPTLMVQTRNGLTIRSFAPDGLPTPISDAVRICPSCRMSRLRFEDDEDWLALAEAVREAGRVTTGLIDDSTAGGGQDPIDYKANFDGADPQRSNHPVFRTRRVADAHQRRRAHLSVVPDVTPEV